MISLALIAAFVLLSCPPKATAGLWAEPGTLELERPTLLCLGVSWQVRGDDNHNASATLEYRQEGQEAWQRGLDLFRVDPAALPQDRLLPAGTWLMAGSLFDLEEDTEYQLRATLTDLEGGGEVRLLKQRTRAVPRAFAGVRQLHVVPGGGGGSGTAADPFWGLAAADSQAQPGDVFLVHAGVYTGTWTLHSSGEPGRPIVWRGGVDGEAILDAQGQAAKRPERGISATGIHDVHFEQLTVRGAQFLMVASHAQRLVLRGCHLYGGEYGFTATAGDSAQPLLDFYLADNTIEGPSTWPRTQGIEDARGIQVSGMGHVICHNRVRGFADAIDTFQGQACTAIDIYHNELSELTDDGIELDYSDRNTRCFRNRLTNVFQGISVQPVYGGPVYIFRNALYNVGLETFKLHNSPSGVLAFHNTSVKQGMPLVLWTKAPVYRVITRNNLFIGTAGNYAFETTAPMEGCDFDRDGFGGGPWEEFLKWNEVRYPTIEEVWGRAPVERQAVLVDPETCFTGGLRAPGQVEVQFPVEVNDLRLAASSGALDRGERLANINDGYSGAAPDLGAFEQGAELPPYGPRSNFTSEGQAR